MADSAVMRPTDLSSPNAEACVEQGLPLDLLCLIFAALDVRSLGRCRQTCRAWRDVIAQFENSIMRSILRRDFGIVCPRDMSPFLAYRTQDSLRKGRGRSRFLIDSDPFVEYLEDDDSSAAGTSLPSERDSDELVEGGGEVAPNHSWGLKRGVENSGSSRSSSRERTIKRPRRFSTAVPGPAGCLDEHVGLPTSDSLRSSWVSRVWNKRRAFAAWPADPGDAYMLVLEMDFLFLLDPSRPNYISVFDLRDNYGTFPDLALDPEAAAFAEGQRKMLSPIATLPNPAPLPNTNPGFGTNAAMIGLILGNGKGSCVTFDEASQICVW